MRRLIGPVFTTVVAALLHQGLPTLSAWLGLTETGAWSGWAGGALAAVFWAATAVSVNRALHVFLWRGWVEQRSGMPVPKLLTDVVGLVIWLTALVCLLRLAFQVEVAGLVTASGVTIAVIGFALRNMIADVFTGIALGIERPLRTGDWIELEDGVVGRVDEINWRATRLVTKEELTKVVPNSYLATTPFANYHTPESFFRDKFQVVLGYDVTAHQAERILLSAVSQITESTRIPRKPEVRIIEYLEHGLRWELRYWVPDYPSMSTIRYRAQRNVLRNLHYAGVQVPRGKLEFLDLAHLRAERDTMNEDIAFLRSLELFDSLETGELGDLSERMRRRLCVAGRPVVRQGDESSASLFIVKEGFLDVTVSGENGEDVAVGWLAPGMFFGEMSLLTGAPCSASVTPSVDALLLEITHEDIAPVLQRRVDMVRRLSDVLADRQMRNDKSLQAASSAVVETKRQRLSERLFSSIVSLFGLGPETRSVERPEARAGSGD